MNELATLDASAQAELVRRGELTPAELVEAAIVRIEGLNPALNAVVTPMYETARATAAALSAESLAEAPFAGVPFLLKDLVAEYAGAPLSEGSAFLAGHYTSPQDSELVRRLKAAGLVVVGKANTPEFGLLPTTEPRFFGPARNPWDRSRTSGGSSGGSAAAVAAGLVPMAHGNDGGGSLRNPASCCGVFGLKPTRGRNPLGPHYGDIASGLAAEHAVTRSVRDSAALLDATSAPDPGAPYAPPPPARPFRDEVGRDPGRLRIAFARGSPTGITVHPDCVAAVEDTAALCAGLGHEVAEASPKLDVETLVKGFTNLWVGTVGWVIEDWARRTGREPAPEHFEPGTWRMYEVARQRSVADHLLTVQDLQGVSRQVAGFFAEVDLWLTPTLAHPPVALGEFDYDPEWSTEGRARWRTRIAQFSHFTLIANVTGQPAMSLPLYWNADGLPVGSHFMARYGDEASLFRLAAQLEAARPWAGRRPPLAA
ncbi:MAG: amidase [Alphaproteobacteria bacterium]